MDGSFRRKESFTVIPNNIIRDKNVPLKAKGLYMIIQSYITMPDKIWKKSEFLNMCVEGQKAFDSAWCMLKEAGYLKVHMKSIGTTFEVEYELCDEKEEGPHTFYYNSAGQLTHTNLSRTPQNGSNGKGSNGNGSNGKGDNNNSKLSINTGNKYFNNHLINREPRSRREDSAGVNDKKIDFGRLESSLGTIRRGSADEVADLSFALKSLQKRKNAIHLRNQTYDPHEILSYLLRLPETDLKLLFEKVIDATYKSGKKKNRPAYYMACLAEEADSFREREKIGEQLCRVDYNAMAMQELLEKLND